MTQALKILSLVIAFSSLAAGQGICARFRPAADGCDLSAAPKEQAKCLLRPVKKFGNLSTPLTSLPALLDTLIGQQTSVSFSRDAVKRFLAEKNISDQDLGGKLSVRISRPKYFVIHDTSDFLSGSTDFPANINQDSWGPNKLSRRVTNKVCHVYINRLGQSATAVPFESTTPPNGTKFGFCHSAQRRDFLHIENIQPRISDRAVSSTNDALAPNPGFTDAQIERLALVYIVASVRSGKWLIPAYHSPVDLGYPNRHDDPQNFDLDKWTAKLGDLIEQIKSSGPADTNHVVSVIHTGAASAEAFDLPQPSALTNRKMLWATHYYVYGDVQSVAGGKPLLSMSGADLGTSLSVRDWCLGAIEGTIRVVNASGEAKVYNFDGRRNSVQVDCSSVIHNPSIDLRAIGSSRYREARGSSETEYRNDTHSLPVDCSR